ncbi:MAG: hypothetical protein H8D22_01030 [Candidatus Cloacimonetes bacterium]|nr:hypothetical protein [Candidatus Cloacimonadota bacterium]
MPLGYVEELASRYFEKKGYLVFPNIRFQLKKEWTHKKVAGWSDIDMIALSIKELIIVQCKSFIGTKKSDEISNDILNWFNYTELFLEEDAIWKKWLKGRRIKKYLIIDYTVKKAESILRKNEIMIFYYSDLLKELLKILKSGEARKGKEDDAIIRLLCAMIDKKMINPKIF